ncbi:peptide/nickel transport system ATP-binding protein [Lentibacillus halodurans]|uniref:Peptide/nickel transport system ATP-binding protein n=1 Tax=Lentibacillus halodurans TaxID=237679 RepID=A0A1I0X7B1_9BACI|nr:ABC transporter ATP-binding protein [Lentibacillus halodurans]SFA96929.1 peptide/nickel transport system ATP-binding protein [Lentibacillus halodurans]
MPQEQHDQNVLDINNLHTGFLIDGELHHAVVDVNLSVKPKEVVCVVGESGCGKSVMSLSIMNLLPKINSKISKGEIIFNGEDLTQKTDEEMNKVRGKDISMIFQEPMTALNPVFTVGSQLQEVLFNHTDMSKQEARERGIDLLKQVGIPRPEKIIDEYPHQLSGGMRQRIMIAISIALNPKLLIADEPTTALDVTVQAQILELMKAIQEKEDMAIMLITHDLGVVAEMADKVIVMYAGKIVETANVVDLFTEPKHPYTKSMISSIPRMDEQKNKLNTIDGIVPSLKNMPHVGCRFADRCPKAFDDCTKITPQLAKVSDDHEARCLLYDACYPDTSSIEKEEVNQ